MKKAFVFTLFLSFASVNAFAIVGQTDAERDAHRQEMKAVKAAQREARKSQPNVPQGRAVGFWQKEGERSGLSRMGNPGDFVKNLNPVPFFQNQDEQYKERKASQNKR